jgi:hypothetical protein
LQKGCGKESMSFAAKGPPPGQEGDPLELSSLGGVDLQVIIPNEAQAQAKKRNPLAVKQTRLWMIREELFGELDEIRIYAERGLRALEVENDLDLGHAFDQSFKHFRAVAANLKALLLVKSGPPR